MCKTKEIMQPETQSGEAVVRSLPTRMELIKLARKYADTQCSGMGSDLENMTMIHLEERNFKKIILWLKEEGF